MTPRGLPPEDPPGEPELDAQWRDIVARLGDLDGDADGPAGSTERDVGPPAAPRRRRDDLPGARTVRPATGRGDRSGPVAEPEWSADDDAGDLGPAGSDPRGWSPDPEVSEAEDHFIPPDPGPVLGGDPLLTMAWIAVIAAPLLVLVALLAWPEIPAWLLQVAGVGFLAGVGLLLWRMPHHRSPDDDSGAVV